MMTLAQWEHLARCSIYRASDGFYREVAAWCFASEQAGHSMGIWHASALITGNRCHCWPCSNARGEEKGRFRYHHVA